MPDATLTRPGKRDKHGKPYRPRRVPPPTEEQVWLIANELRRMPRAMALVAAYSGLRVAEVCDLRGKDIVRDGDKIVLHVRHGKGDKARHSVLLPPAHDALPLTTQRDYVFVNRGEKFNTQMVRSRWQTARRRVGLTHVWFHDLRKFHASQLINMGVSATDMAIQLGHFDAYGRPNVDLVHRVYAYLDHGECLNRIAAIYSQEGSRL